MMHTPSSAPLRVLFVSDVFPPRSYGSGQSAYHLARGLREAGHAVRVVVCQPTLAGMWTDYDGFPVWRPDNDARRLPDVAFSANGLAAGAAIQRLLRDWQPDVLHAQHVHSALVATRAAEGIPVVVTVRDHWATCFYGTALAETPCPGCLTGTKSPCNIARGTTTAPAVLRTAKAAVMRATLAQRHEVLRKAAAVIAVSGAIADELAPHVTPERLFVIPNGIDTAALAQVVPADNPALPPAYFVSVGKLAYHKGTDRLPEIMQRLPQDAPPLVVLGDGPDAAMLRAADSTGNRIRLLGVRPNDETLRIMAGAVALLFPVRWDEPLSRTHLEALALGVPIIATATGGTPDAVRDGITGFLVGRGDTNALAARAAQLWRDNALRARMRDAARAHARNTFDIHAVAQRTALLYRVAVNR